MKETATIKQKAAYNMCITATACEPASRRQVQLTCSVNAESLAVMS